MDVKSKESSVEDKSRVWIDLLKVIFSVVVAAASTLPVIGLREGAPRFYIILAGVILTLIVFTRVALWIQRGPSEIAQVKSRLQSAYLNALDESFLNPNKHLAMIGQRHELPPR